MLDCQTSESDQTSHKPHNRSPQKTTFLVCVRPGPWLVELAWSSKQPGCVQGHTSPTLDICV